MRTISLKRNYRKNYRNPQNVRRVPTLAKSKYLNSSHFGYLNTPPCGLKKSKNNPIPEVKIWRELKRQRFKLSPKRVDWRYRRKEKYYKNLHNGRSEPAPEKRKNCYKFISRENPWEETSKKNSLRNQVINIWKSKYLYSFQFGYLNSPQCELKGSKNSLKVKIWRKLKRQRFKLPPKRVDWRYRKKSIIKIHTTEKVNLHQKKENIVINSFLERIFGKKHPKGTY